MTKPALELPDAWRQSRIATFDACPLSLKFDMEIPLRQLPGKMGHLGARGVLSHRAFAACLNHMRAHNERSIGVDMAMELLARVIAQRDMPTSDGLWEPCADEDVVHLPTEELHWLRVLVVRWVYGPRGSGKAPHEYSIERVHSVERRLYADIQVRGPDDTVYTRRITGAPDVLIQGPADDEATVLDYKTGYAKPSRPKEPTPDNLDPTPKLSDMGYVQQTVYGFLIMKNFPGVDKVTEREWYLWEDQDPIRQATVQRWEMERIEDILAGVISQMDAAVLADPALRKRQAEARQAKKQIPYGRWFPIPGTHCGTCVGRRLCPIRKDLGIPDTLEEAQKLAREWHVAGEIRKERIPYVKGWVDAHGPIPIAHAKGRRVVGYNGSNSLSMFEPKGAPPSPFDAELEAVARDAGVLTDANQTRREQ